MDGVSEIAGAARVKKHASMEQVAPACEIQATDAMEHLSELKEQFEYALGLSQGLRSQMEGALDKLSPSK